MTEQEKTNKMVAAFFKLLNEFSADGMNEGQTIVTSALSARNLARLYDIIAETDKPTYRGTVPPEDSPLSRGGL